MASLFKSIKLLREAKKLEKADAAAALPIRPGYYGEFPNTFTVYAGGEVKDKDRVYTLFDIYYLCFSEGMPAQVFIAHKSNSNRMLSLYPTTSSTTEPLALVTLEKSFRLHMWPLYELPAPPGVQANTQIEKMVDHSSIRKSTQEYSFEVLTGTNGELRPEQFEWRKTEKLTEQKPLEMFLYRKSSLGAVVVAEFRGEQPPYPQGKMGTFNFMAAGATGELGPYWRLMAVTTGLSLCQVKWMSEVAADHIITETGKVLLKGGAMGVGMSN